MISSESLDLLGAKIFLNATELDIPTTAGSTAKRFGEMSHGTNLQVILVGAEDSPFFPREGDSGGNFSDKFSDTRGQSKGYSDVSPCLFSERDGARTRNFRIDSPVL